MPPATTEIDRLADFLFTELGGTGGGGSYDDTQVVADIALNASEISSNATDIGQNTADIAATQSSIATNSSAIANLGEATNVAVDGSGFSGNLSASDVDVQTALATIDGLSIGGGVTDAAPLYSLLNLTTTSPAVPQINFGNTGEVATSYVGISANNENTLINAPRFTEINGNDGHLFQVNGTNIATLTTTRLNLIGPNLNLDSGDLQIGGTSGANGTFLKALGGGNGHSWASIQADEVVVDASGFSGNLSSTDDDVQAALSTIDALALGGGATAVNDSATPVEVFVYGEDTSGSKRFKQTFTGTPNLITGDITIGNIGAGHKLAQVEGYIVRGGTLQRPAASASNSSEWNFVQYEPATGDVKLLWSMGSNLTSYEIAIHWYESEVILVS